MLFEEVIKDLNDEDKINVSFNGKDHYRYRIKNIKTKHAKLLKYEVLETTNKFVFIRKAREQQG